MKDRRLIHVNRKMVKIQLQLFDVINTTESTGSGNELSPEMKTYYYRYLLENVGPNLIHDQFGQEKPIPKNGGKTIEFRKYTQLKKALTPLEEGETPAGDKLDVSVVKATVKQYGNYIRLSDMLLLTAIDNNLVEAMNLLGAQAAQTLDTVTREVINAGTNVQYAEGQVDSRAELTPEMKLTVRAIRLAVRTLKRRNARPIEGQEYAGIIHSDIAFDLMDDEAFVEWNKYTTPEKMWKNEIGKVAGVRLSETTEAKIFPSAGAQIGEGPDRADVYSTLIIGRDAYGITSVEGGGLETIVKQLGSGGTSDPLNQRATAGWKAVKTAEILQNDFMVRIETGSSNNIHEAN